VAADPAGPQGGERKPLVWIALLFAAQIALLNYGTAYTAASRAGLLINAYPLFVPVIAHFSLRGDRLTWNKASGTLLAFLGILCVSGERFGKANGTTLGDGLVLVSALFLAARVVYTSALVRGTHPVVLLFWQSVLSLPLFLAASALTESHDYHWNPAVVFSIGYQGIVVAGVCFLGWTALLARFSPVV
jgi:drug/metabolite transporter (DMT)-like permease